jgi:hypothetical protein
MKHLGFGEHFLGKDGAKPSSYDEDIDAEVVLLVCDRIDADLAKSTGAVLTATASSTDSQTARLPWLMVY